MAIAAGSLLRKYSPMTCDVLSELRTSGEYCDVTLRTDDQHQFKAHRAILCCKSNMNRVESIEASASQRAVRSFERCSPMA